jgi:hypothetical protein
LAQQVGLLSDLDYRRLRRQIGESAEKVSLPVWSRATAQLTYQGKVIRILNAKGKDIRLILDAFEEQGWPSRVDNPLPGGKDSRKLRRAIENLNKFLTTLRFSADGAAAGILWHMR